MSTPVFRGTPEQQELADRIFRTMKLQGSFFSANAPIRQSLKNLADFFAKEQDCDTQDMEQQIESALQENTEVFTREIVDDEVIYLTSRMGAYIPYKEDLSHNFAQRFYEPENPLPVDDISVVVSTSRPVLTSVEPVMISDYWQEQAEFAQVPSGKDYGEDDETVYEGGDSYVVSHDDSSDSTTSSPMMEDGDVDKTETALAGMIDNLVASIESSSEPSETVDVSPATQDVSVADDSEPHDASSTKTDDVEVIEPEPSEMVAVSETKLVDEATDKTMEADEDAISPEVLDVSGKEVVEEVQAEEEPEPEPDPETIQIPVLLPNGVTIDLSKPSEEIIRAHKDILETVLKEQIDKDPLRRIVHFGRSFYPESGIVSMGKNDLRRIRDYIIEVSEPLLDTAIIADLYYHNPRHSDYEGFRFSLNYRLSREKDFEFVGVEGARLWSTKGLSAIGTKRVKVSEMGHLTSYLTETEYDNSTQTQSIESIQEAGQVDHLLTFFEWEYGILPLDRSIQALLPNRMLEDQRSAVLRIDSPQHYSNFLVEVRYPTGNRGGWIQGFENFFHEHMIAGGMITLARTDEPNVFTIVYEEMAPVTDRVLLLDEKKNKFFFSDISFYCTVDDDWVMQQKRFGKIKNLKSLPMGERRKSDFVLRHVFETVGEQVGTRDRPRYCMWIEDLFKVYNVLRPTSISYLRSLLVEDEDFMVDDSDPNLYYFEPEPEPEEDVEEEVFEPEEYIVGGRRWTYGDDDE